MPQSNVVRQLPEEGHPISDQHGISVDDDPVDQPRPQEGLNRPAAVDVDVPEISFFEEAHRLPR